MFFSYSGNGLYALSRLVFDYTMLFRQAASCSEKIECLRAQINEVCLFMCAVYCIAFRIKCNNSNVGSILKILE